MTSTWSSRFTKLDSLFGSVQAQAFERDPEMQNIPTQHKDSLADVGA